MKHRNSHLLAGYWNRLRAGRAVPDQADIDPRTIKRILSYVFILEASDTAGPLYRLAGTSHCDRYGAELKGTSFLARWESRSRSSVTALLRQATHARQPICVSSFASCESGTVVEVETLLAPLTFGGSTPARFIGVSQILGDSSALMGQPITMERFVSAQLVSETETLLPPDKLPPAAPPVLRAYSKAPHLRLVSSREAPVPSRFEADAAMKRIIAALEIVLQPTLRAVS
jgi:hypothetical protein